MKILNCPTCNKREDFKIAVGVGLGFLIFAAGFVMGCISITEPIMK